MSEIRRDHYGLRLNLRRKSPPNEQRDRLRSVTQHLRDELDRNHFALECLDRITCQITQVGQFEKKKLPPSLAVFPEKEGDEVLRFGLEISEIERRLLDIEDLNVSLFRTLRRLIKLVVSGPQVVSELTAHLDGYQRSTSCGDGGQQDLPQIFYRLHNSPKGSYFDPELGILCPGWRKHASAHSPIAKEHVIQHLRAEQTSPPFISVHDSPARIINLSKCVDFSEWRKTRILVISFDKLQKIGSWCRRSTEIPGIPNGVPYVTDSHWLIHRWVPLECIVTELWLDHFVSFCEGIGIVHS